MPANPNASTAPAPPATDAAKAETVKVTVPQQGGTIIVNTFDTETPYTFEVNRGVIEATKAEADLLVARVDGASISS